MSEVMTWWDTLEWHAYEVAYGDPPGTPSRELAPATCQTRILDLTPSEAVLWAAIPKTMRQAIRKGERSWQIRIGNFDAYQDVHQQTAQRQRSDETYRCQRRWVAMGCAVVTTAHSSVEARVGACYVIRYQGWAYYASGPSLLPHVMPALIWRAMRACQALGDHLFEVGWQDHAEDAKGQSMDGPLA